MNSSSEVVISVIIPTYNRFEQLSKCLMALTKQSLEENWEIIVVDDGGRINLNSLIDEFKTNLKISLLTQINKGPATARNYGVKYATGEFVAFLDDDCEPHEHWLENLFKKAEAGMMVGGQTINKLKTNIYSEASQLLVSFLYDYFLDTPWYFFTSNNFLLSKKDFLEVNGFDEGFSTSAGEDREFCARCIQKGITLKNIPAAIIYHVHHLNFSSFWKMHFKYGRASIFYMKKLEQLSVSAIPFQIRFYVQLLMYPMKKTHLNLLERGKLLSTICLSQLATLFGFFSAKLSSAK